MPADIRKLIVQVDETRREMGRDVNPPTRRALAMAVITNPFAGRYEENLDALIAIGDDCRSRASACAWACAPMCRCCVTAGMTRSCCCGLVQ